METWDDGGEKRVFFYFSKIYSSRQNYTDPVISNNMSIAQVINNQSVTFLKKNH
jgi:hypothetical protein